MTTLKQEVLVILKAHKVSLRSLHRIETARTDGTLKLIRRKSTAKKVASSVACVLLLIAGVGKVAEHFAQGSLFGGHGYPTLQEDLR